MRYGTNGLGRNGSRQRDGWRAWAGPGSAAVVDADLATMLDRRDDVECGLRVPGRWRRLRW